MSSTNKVLYNVRYIEGEDFHSFGSYFIEKIQVLKEEDNGVIVAKDKNNRKFSATKSMFFNSELDAQNYIKKTVLDCIYAQKQSLAKSQKAIQDMEIFLQNF